MKKINCELSSHSLNRAIRELEDYQKYVEEKTKELCEMLAIWGRAVAQENFDKADYDTGNDAVVTVEPIENGYCVKASGTSVCYIEFGAGVRYGYGYPGEKPSGIDEIGMHNTIPPFMPPSKGINPNGWYVPFYGTTLGNPPNAPMFNTEVALREQVIEIAKEVFG